jgi:hypothetical protein
VAAPGSKKPEAHTLEYVEDFHEADAADHVSQLNGNG